tara:strand:- start:15232 stop:16122 length:891 start_codon:yes stop_codon:yes gene_type:complete
MNFQKACKILDINSKQKINIDELKHKYKRGALKYHPDKNNSIDAKNKFQEVSEAYQYLCENNMNLNELSQANTSYSDILFTFINTIIPVDKDTGVIHVIIQKLTHICETKSNDFLDNLDKETLIKIYNIIKMNKDIFHIKPEYISKIESIINNKVQNDEVIILNPTLEDLFDNNLYRLTIDKKTYIIPLWHHELQYDNNGKDLYVRCNPVLLDDIEVDEINDIHFYKTYNIHDLWGQEHIDVEIGSRIFTVEVNKLKIMRNQTIFICNSGISRPNIKNIYDVSILSTVHIHLTLEL